VYEPLQNVIETLLIRTGVKQFGLLFGYSLQKFFIFFAHGFPVRNGNARCLGLASGG
jgi:hypothetical protein